ncbi:NAD-dependent epimerase/dehydratase family protein [Dactylosporangium matsuzakiense]|uniref:NAD-dependent epimerase n=1 Tax=Dactylosporangium matsuzakiense TaxID=53360 RepID=A0A9W6NS70_9ACTN|nr:NAD-dependent epimerase/dehydratase family protein [Dactylosporangium matsuzakiense]UWZ41457.1 NAD-dependent epimerase/dehydratase family protein [Dactylosporangium matsuzakiense]GLL07016.1 NAD-dependent epimerase [Dactylosporangium matsuzakiense]
MHIVVVGATGNMGTALLRRLRADGNHRIVGVARRLPSGAEYTGMVWRSCDIGAPDAVRELTGIFAGADAVVHLGWQIQPSHDRAQLLRTNVDGSRAVIDAAVEAGVGALVAASSVGVYAPGPKDRRVDESWPATGAAASSYSRDKVTLEGMLDAVESRLRVVRLRPGLIFQRDAGTEIARYFLGPFAPVRLLRFGRVPVIPEHPRLRLQAVHADDVADAYVRAITQDVTGAFNIAADPVLTPALAAEMFHGRTVPVPAPLLRGAADVSWRLRLQPVDVGWVQLALSVPLLDTARAATELGWRPAVGADAALRELTQGMARHAHAGSPPLSGNPLSPGRLAGLLRGRLPGTGNPY